MILALSTSQQITKSALVAVGVVFVVVFAGAVVYRLTRGVRSDLQGRRFATRIRANTAYDLATAAGADVLELGERIDARRMTPTQDAAHWQAALDCYEAASYAHDHARGPADELGAVVLAMMGQDHLDSAVDAAAFDDRPLCFFDPRHGRRYGDASGPEGTVRSVPACRRCRGARQGSRSAFVIDGEPYYRAGIEPWASSGYGSIGDVLAAFGAHRW